MKTLPGTDKSSVSCLPIGLIDGIPLEPITLMVISREIHFKEESCSLTSSV